jgi:hypothetical protein
MLSDEILKIIQLMNCYQQQYKIKQECITNVKYLYDNIILDNPLSKAKAIAVICVKGGKSYAHLIIIDGSDIYDPSFDINSINNIKYFDNVDEYTNLSTLESKQFTLFSECALKINNNIHIEVNEKYINDQEDYVEAKLLTLMNLN